MKLDLETNIEGRHVLLVEDIVDTGVTLSYLMENLGGRNPKSLEVVTLLSKPTAHIQYLRLKYIGFEIPPEFVVGFGLDYNEDYRNIADICIYEG